MESNNTFPLIEEELRERIIKEAEKFNKEQALKYYQKHVEGVLEEQHVGMNLAEDIIKNIGQKAECEIIDIDHPKNPAELIFHIKLKEEVSFTYEGKKFIVGPELFFDCRHSTAYYAGSKVFGRYSIKNDLVDYLNENLLGKECEVFIVPGAPHPDALEIYAILDVSAEWVDKKSSCSYPCYPFAGFATKTQEWSWYGATLEV